MTQASLPPLNALRAFEAAGRLLSFRAAADELGVTQSAIAQQIRLLEGDVGLRLFHRHPRGVTLTDPARAYHAAVGESLAALRRATAQLRPAPSRVTISVTPSFAAKWLIPRLPEMTAALPGIDLQVVATDRVSRFHGDGIDLAVRQGQGPFPATLTSTRLFRTEVIAVCAPILMPTGTDRMPRDLFLNHTRLQDSHGLWERYLGEAFGAEAAQSRAPSLHFSQTALCLDAALAGQGIALAAHFLVARDLREGRLVQARPDRLEMPDGFHLLAPRRLSDSARAVAQWLNDQAESGV